MEGNVMSWKPEFEYQGKWCDNAQRFASKEEAEESALARFRVWTMPTAWRAIESSRTLNYVRREGNDSPIK